MADWIGGRWAYWGRQVSAGTILERSAEQSARAVLTVGVAAVGVLGFGSLVAFVADLGGITPESTPLLLERRHDPRLFLFSLSLVADLYLVYRAARARDRVSRIPRSMPAVSAPGTVRVEQLSQLERDQTIDIATTLTPEALRAIEEAWQLASRFGAGEVKPAFLFAALLSYRKIAALRGRLGTDDKKLVGLLQKILSSHSTPGATSPVFGSGVRAALLAAYARASARRALRLDVTDLFAALATTAEDLRELMDELGIPPVMVENVTAWITIQEDLRQQWKYFRARARFKPKSGMNRAMTATATPLLDRYAHDLTQLARNGFLHPCIARDKEMDEIFRLMEGGHNVVLVGNPGVGKTAIVDGIAQRMVTEDVPEILQDKRLVSLSIATLVGSDARFGGLEQRLNTIINEMTHSGNIVLVLDNLQNLVGVSSAGGATLDLSEIVSAALANKQFLSLATTNPLDFRRYIEPAAGLASAYTRITIEEVETDAAIRILEATSATVEYRHHVYFSYAAIEKLVTLSRRYLHDRYLPEKAISLMEEVAVAVHTTRRGVPVVTAEDVARVVAEKTNIALTQVSESESGRLLHLEERIHERVIGQDEAVTAVASALRRARTELRDMKRPIVNLLFLGPTGVGKTELAKTVAEVYFGGEANMIRLDMSEYQESGSIAQLLGASPGFSGSGSGGYLTEAVRRQPFALVLLDELEKAHPDILNVFLQVMDDGRLTDSSGRTIDFTNVILIATSNAGTEILQDGLRAQRPLESIKAQLLQSELRKYFRPEFLNRFDQIVVFRPLSKTEIVSITKLLLGEVARRLAEKGITLEASEAAIRELADAGFDPLFGARPMRRLIQDRVDDALAKFLLTGKLGRRDTVILEPGGTLRIREAPAVWERHDASRPTAGEDKR